MGSKMLIDAAHPEETRVVVVRGNNRIEELDYESASRKRLRGNIYLAKVTRVEPSLQAAFIDYGGNRHGFLAFNEIHPDYDQIPVADRQALLEQEAEEQHRDAEEDDAKGAERPKRRRRSRKAAAAAKAETETVVEEVEAAEDAKTAEEPESAAEEPEAVGDEALDDEGTGDEDAGDNDAGDDEDENGDDENGDDDNVESVGSEDALEEVPQRSHSRKRSYKIQEVIKRRQIILVQVVKEERGNKGAALTTYLSLAGRYCVLMPNTARGGGISRKITDVQDRKRLKDVTKSISVPDGMGLIVRTAGASRTKAEIKRDFDYLIRLWENVRDLTLKSTAPCLVYEEGSLIKRAIRDLYSKDMDEILVEGEAGYKEAKDFMRMLTPSHARHVKLHSEGQPLFMQQKIENQLDVLYSPQVTLPSGGYIVINQAEALVAVDVNSGKSTREHNIEDTALRTNLEAADEVARQMRLRDLAGLLVIDFIDMEERRNNRSVERRLKERLKSDRARIQVGRISHFGLLEMSRQRMRSGVLESSTRTCPACNGQGIVRSVPSASLQVLRAIEEYLQRSTKDNLIVQAPPGVILYVLNQKRDHLLALESSYGVSIYAEANDELGDSEFAIDRMSDRPEGGMKAAPVVQVDSPFLSDDETESDTASEDGSKRGRRRRRRGRRGSRQSQGAEASDDDTPDEEAAAAPDEGGEDGEDTEKRSARKDDRPRRGRRGGRRRSRSSAATADDGEAAGEENGAATDDPEASDAPDAEDVQAPVTSEIDAEAATAEEEKPRKPRRSRSRRKAADDDTAKAGSEKEAQQPEAVEEADEKANGAAENGAGQAEPEAEPEAAEADNAEAEAVEADGEAEAADGDELEAPCPPAPAQPARRGWWQKRV